MKRIHEHKPLTDDQIETLIAHFENERAELDDPLMGYDSDWANNQRLALPAMRELQLLRAQVDDQAAIILRLERQIIAQRLPDARAPYEGED